MDTNKHRPIHGGRPGTVVIKVLFESRQWAPIGSSILETDSMQEAESKQRRYDIFHSTDED